VSLCHDAAVAWRSPRALSGPQRRDAQPLVAEGFCAAAAAAAPAPRAHQHTGARTWLRLLVACERNNLTPARVSLWPLQLGAPAREPRRTLLQTTQPIACYCAGVCLTAPPPVRTETWLAFGVAQRSRPLPSSVSSAAAEPAAAAVRRPSAADTSRVRVSATVCATRAGAVCRCSPSMYSSCSQPSASAASAVALLS
jgi:hypothetical protein